MLQLTFEMAPRKRTATTPIRFDTNVTSLSDRCQELVQQLQELGNSLMDEWNQLVEFQAKIKATKDIVNPFKKLIKVEIQKLNALDNEMKRAFEELKDHLARQ